MYKVGFSKKEITPKVTNVGMFGFGMYEHRVEEVETPLFVRSCIFEDDTGSKVAQVYIEIGAISPVLKREVVRILAEKHSHLGFNDANILLAATHTHSAPGGHFHHPLYNFSIPGFHESILSIYTNGIVESIIEANSNKKNSDIIFKESEFDSKLPVAFNRSLEAYLENPESKKVSYKDRHLALDRTSRLLEVKSDGVSVGCINWFGVHTTSVGNNFNKICSDNKGYAASLLEAEQSKSYVGIFAQAPCGDVSPNYIPKEGTRELRGTFKDPYKSASYNGEIQKNKVSELLSQKDAKKISGAIDSEIIYVDLTSIEVDKEFIIPDMPQRTGKATMGISFIEGTRDGIGIHGIAAKILRIVVKTINFWKVYLYKSASFRQKKLLHSTKDIFLESSDKKVLGISNFSRLPKVDRTFAVLKDHYKKGALKEHTMAPEILPIQLHIIGSIAIAGIPGEPTTVSGLRMKKLLLDTLKEKGVEHVIIAPYANSYSGYITTPEEYRLQKYEAGHTMFGEATLGAYLTKMKFLAKQMLLSTEDRSLDKTVTPPIFSNSELIKRSFNPIF